ncbi:flagellar filament capping protein FliD [Fonticella tunisiensis]|uniref:Flagellar hook-associated protein 2 n=1 Tax=Fonticella tunisiensis TaxID=1096341 RepID=A0A4R7KAB7_9CLOT|nr:flagellar filament capping protein FliD [Fonticella tunisiensis]TDT50619.1 flagellar hook-associated protein 2 [Fonticella tunisiensis]
MSDMLRITGLATGLDVDSMVKTMMKAENVKLDKLKQDRQIVQWKQELYREILGDINTFKSTYFDVLKPDSYMLSVNSYAAFDISHSDEGSTTTGSIVSVSAGAGAVPGTYSVQVINLAEPAKISGNALNQSLAVTDTVAQSWLGQSIGFSIDGASEETIKLDKDENGQPYTINTVTDLVSAINDQISNNINLKGKVTAEIITQGSDNYIRFNALTNSIVKITSASVTDPANDILANLKGKIINPTTSTKLSDLGVTGPTSLKLSYDGGNSTTINIDTNKTIGDVIDAISEATSGNVIAKYSELTKTFTIQTVQTGSSKSLTIDSSSSTELLNALGITSGDGLPGEDAEVTITPPGGSATTIKKSSNTFTIDGITYNILQESGDPPKIANITLTSNVQKTFDKIKAFIDKYNEIVDKIQKKLNEKRQYDYKPLTDDQKKEMKDDDIKRWEEKAKEGLLKNDSMLQNMLYSMRRAFYDGVEGAGISLKDAGLSTSSDYLQGGKIIIDEAKLKDAIQNRGEQLAKLFMKDSDINYDPDHKNDSERYDQIGIFQRINDILKDYTRTTRDSSGRKGILIETAGIVGDLSEFNNMLSRQIANDYDKKISELTDKLSEKEDKYYEQFARLEVAMQKMNQQSAWLMQQLGFSGGVS